NSCPDQLITIIFFFQYVLLLSFPPLPSYPFILTSCGGDFTAQSGRFMSPNYPDGYPVNIECVWNIRTPPGNQLQLTFPGTYCGRTPPANVIQSTGSTLSITFRSDSSVRRDGFVLTYEL
ncbi:unnamed protein product, partial [Candidula unifasciata]